MKIIVKSNKRLSEIQAGTRYYDVYKNLKSDTKKNMADLLGGKQRVIIPFDSISPKIMNDSGSIMQACSFMVNIKYNNLQRYMKENESNPYMVQASYMVKRKQNPDKEDDLVPSEYAVDMLMGDLENLFYFFHKDFNLYADLQLRQFIKDIPKTLPDGRDVVVKKRFSIPVLLSDFEELLKDVSVNNPKYNFFKELFVANKIDNDTIILNLLEQFKLQVIDAQEVIKIYKNHLIDSIMRSNGTTLVISRVPVDILRMGDFPNLESCHTPEYQNSQGGSYGLCSIQEAVSEYGLIAYLFDIEPKNLTKEQVNDIENTEKEFMQHTDQRIKGLGPISRIRIRTYKISYDTNEVMLSVPSPGVYGIQPSGLYKFLVEYFANKQASVIEKLKTEAKRVKYKKHFIISLMGGFYHDSEEVRVISEFLGVPQDRFETNKATYENREYILQSEIKDEYKNFIKDTLYNEYEPYKQIIFTIEGFDYRGYTTSKTGGGLKSSLKIIYSIDSVMKIAEKNMIKLEEWVKDLDSYKELISYGTNINYTWSNDIIFITDYLAYPNEKEKILAVLNSINKFMTQIHTDI